MVSERDNQRPGHLVTVWGAAARPVPEDGFPAWAWAYAYSACHGGRDVSEQEDMTIDMYEVELEPAEPDGFAASVPALPGLLVLDSDVDEVLRRVRVAIVERDGCGLLPIRLAVRRKDRGELLLQSPGLRRGQRDLQPRELVGARPRFS